MTKTTTKLVHEGEFVAEVAITLEVTDDPWAPYLSLADAERLDQTRRALQQGDLRRAAQYGRVFQLTPVHP